MPRSEIDGFLFWGPQPPPSFDPGGDGYWLYDYNADPDRILISNEVDLSCYNFDDYIREQR